MKLDKGKDHFQYEATLTNGEEISIFPGVYQGEEPEEEQTYLYILFRKSLNSYRITNGDFQQLKEEEFESEQDLVDKLLVAKI